MQHWLLFLVRISQEDSTSGAQGGVEVNPSLEKVKNIHRGEEVIKPQIERDILRVSGEWDLCYRWRNSWIIVTIEMWQARLMDTALLLYSRCLTEDKHTQVYNNFGVTPS